MGPGKDTHGAPVPTRWGGRGWPALRINQPHAKINKACDDQSPHEREPARKGHDPHITYNRGSGAGSAAAPAHASVSATTWSVSVVIVSRRSLCMQSGCAEDNVCSHKFQVETQLRHVIGIFQ